MSQISVQKRKNILKSSFALLVKSRDLKFWFYCISLNLYLNLFLFFFSSYLALMARLSVIFATIVSLACLRLKV